MQDFKLGGAHLKKLRRAEGGAKIFGVLRVKNHDFTPKNHIFSNFRGGARRVRPPPPGSAPDYYDHATLLRFHLYAYLSRYYPQYNFLGGKKTTTETTHFLTFISNLIIFW